MKNQIIIFTLFILGLTALAGNDCTAAAEDCYAPFPESEISPDNDYSDSYIRYNCAFNASTVSFAGSARTGGIAGHQRTNISLQHRLADHNEIRDWAGLASVLSFQTFINRFPSGKMSENHHFISLHKLVI